MTSSVCCAQLFLSLRHLSSPPLIHLPLLHHPPSSTGWLSSRLKAFNDGLLTSQHGWPATVRGPHSKTSFKYTDSTTSIIGSLESWKGRKISELSRLSQSSPELLTFGLIFRPLIELAKTPGRRKNAAHSTRAATAAVAASSKKIKAINLSLLVREFSHRGFRFQLGLT